MFQQRLKLCRAAAEPLNVKLLRLFCYRILRASAISFWVYWCIERMHRTYPFAVIVIAMLAQSRTLRLSKVLQTTTSSSSSSSNKQQ
jgi:hypothetical protein